jgi:hypothetical protein
MKIGTNSAIQSTESARVLQALRWPTHRSACSVANARPSPRLKQRTSSIGDSPSAALKTYAACPAARNASTGIAGPISHSGQIPAEFSTRFGSGLKQLLGFLLHLYIPPFDPAAVEAPASMKASASQLPPGPKFIKLVPFRLTCSQKSAARRNRVPRDVEDEASSEPPSA